MAKSVPREVIKSRQIGDTCVFYSKPHSVGDSVSFRDNSNLCAAFGFNLVAVELVEFNYAGI